MLAPTVAEVPHGGTPWRRAPGTLPGLPHGERRALEFVASEFDYANRQISLNRAQTELEPDGSYRIVVAQRDPGVPNWLDTEGRAVGMICWRFMLAQGEIDTPVARLVPLEDLAQS